MQIAAYRLPVSALDKLPGTERNLLLAVMMAHNELSILNRLLLFSIKETCDDTIGQISHSMQIFFVLKLVAGKLNETWKIIQKHYVSKLDAKYDAILEPPAKSAYTKLSTYFDQKNKHNVIKFLRNNAGFHYSGFDYGKSLKDLADGEDKIYLAQHPANSVYYIGEAANWRSLMLLLRDTIALDEVHDVIEGTPAAAAIEAHLENSVDVDYRRGFNVVNRHISYINFEMHLFLYGVISITIERALGKNWHVAEREMINIMGAPNPYDVALPTFVDMDAAKAQGNEAHGSG